MRRGHLGKLGPTSGKAEWCLPVRASPLGLREPSLGHLLSWGLVKALGWSRNRLPPHSIPVGLSSLPITGTGQSGQPFLCLLSVGGPTGTLKKECWRRCGTRRCISPPLPHRPLPVETRRRAKGGWHPAGLVCSRCRCFLLFSSAAGDGLYPERKDRALLEEWGGGSVRCSSRIASGSAAGLKVGEKLLWWRWDVSNVFSPEPTVE